MNPIGPRGVYDEAKRYAEALTMAYHRQQGVDTCIVRIFNTYGPRMRPHDGRAIPTFMRQALANEPLTVFGDGSQTRSFCYVDDLVRGLDCACQERGASAGEHRQPAEYTLLELAQKVVEATGATSEIVFEALPVDDPKVRQPDITRARQLLGWEPQVSLEDGLRRILQANSTGVTECLNASPCSRWPSRPSPASPCPRRRPHRRSTATKQSSHLLVGINDEAYTLYGDPTTAFATLKSLNTQVLRVNLYWGGTKWAVANVAADRPDRPGRPGATTGRSTTGSCVTRRQYNIKVVFSILFTPGWANGDKAQHGPADELQGSRRTSRTRPPSGTAASGPRRRGSRTRRTRRRSCRSRR